MKPRKKKTYRHHCRCWLCTPYKFTGKPRISVARRLQVGRLERREAPDPIRVDNQFFAFGWAEASEYLYLEELYELSDGS